MTIDDSSLFKLPHQDLLELSLFKPQVDNVAAWIEALPRTQIGDISKLLFTAVTELNRYKLTPTLRIELLDTLRPVIHYTTIELGKIYLNQPIMMSEVAQKSARISQLLSEHLATGYILAALHVDAISLNDSNSTQVLATSLHRAINELCEIILLHTQLYRDPPAGTWLKLHQMMLLSHKHLIDQQKVYDPLNKESTTLSAAYLRVALLGAAKPFQLRQPDIRVTAKALQEWSSFAQLIDWPQDHVPVIGVNPAEDMPPRLGELLKNHPAQHFAVCTKTLVAELQRLHDNTSPGAITLKLNRLIIPVDLIKHLIHAWSEHSKRNFMRLEAHESVDLCLGLSATHHFVSDGVDFERLLEGQITKKMAMAVNNRFINDALKKSARKKDIWDTPYENNFGRINITLPKPSINPADKQSSDDEPDKRFATYQVDTVNTSPGGYCIKWQNSPNTQIRAGDIVGIREKGNVKWSIGVIRWAKNDNNCLQLGIELISPSAQPYGARPIPKVGEAGNFHRVLLLPELKALGLSASLITANVPFKPQQKVVLRREGKDINVKLDNRIAGNSVYSQFTFRPFGENVKTDDGYDFDNLWP